MQQGTGMTWERVREPKYWTLCAGCNREKLFGTTLVGDLGWRNTLTGKVYCDGCKHAQEAGIVTS